MKFTKEDVGKTIFAKPTGNASRHRNSTVKRFKVLKVKRKYVDLVLINEDDSESNIIDSYSPENGATQSEINRGYGENSGYLFFRSEDDILKLNELLSMKKELKDYFQYSFELDYESCKKVVSIIKDSK